MYKLYDFNDIWKTILLLGCVHGLVHFYKIKVTIQWPILHVIGNLYIVVRSFDAVSIFIRDPLGALAYKNNTEDIVDTRLILLTLHVYHQLMFKMNAEDKWHHYMFVYPGTAFIHFTKMGVFLGIYNLFICGLPGAVFYSLLVLKGLNIITKEQGFSIHRLIDLWVRSPGLIMTFSFGFIICLTHSMYLQLIPITFLTVYNGQHYLDVAIRNYERMKITSSA